MTGRLGKNNVFTSLKMLPCLYSKCEFELEDYHNLFRKKVQNDWDSFSGFYAQETGVDSPLVQVPTRGGVLVSQDRDEVLQVGPSAFAERFLQASRVQRNLKDTFEEVENKCRRLNLFKELPAGWDRLGKTSGLLPASGLSVANRKSSILNFVSKSLADAQIKAALEERREKKARREPCL